MASKKSELVLTCNATALKDVMNFLNKQLDDLIRKRDQLNAKGVQNWTAQDKRNFKQWGDDIAAINSAMQKNRDEMVKYGQVMKDLSGSKLKDLKSALREATTSLNKMSEKSPGRQKLIDDIKRIKDQISGTSGLTMSFRQAQTQLKNLDGTSMEKLKQGLAAIKAQLDNPNIGNKWRRSLEQMQQQYQAAMAVRTAPTGVMPVTKMNAQQLGAERTALMSAIAATSGVKGYESKTAGMEQRLKSVNEQLKLLTENEKKADQAAKQLQATQEAAQTVRAVYRNQAVELEKLQAAYKTLQARQQQFAGTNDAKARAAAQQMALLKNRIDKVTAAMQAEIKIDKSFLRTATNQQLQNALTQLQQKLQSLNSTQSKAAQKLKADMKAVETQIKNNTGAIRQQGNTFGTAIKNIAAYVGVFGAFNMIKTKIMSVYKSNLKLSDSLADIRKVSGLTTEEINKLYTNIAKIDSRNTIETLNKLAYTGAKLGIGQNYGVEGLTGFVRAAEQVQMALGEDLGEEALPALAKLTEVMNLIPRYGVEQAMQKSASAIFQLGATSTATGKNIVEFSKRLMGLANVSRVSADELLAIGSAADAMGLMPEVAATAFNKLFTSIQKGHNMIEKSLGLVKGSINENFSKGQTIKSIVDIFDAMNKKGNMNALDGIFKDLGSDGARLVAVMTTMADRVDILKKHLETSTKAFKDGTAVINEYMIQNETANALMQRASNLWAKAFTNPEGIDMVKQLAEQWYEVSKALTQSESSMYVFHSSLEKITNTVVSLIKILPFLIKMLTWMAVFGGIRMLANSFAALVVSINAARTATASLQVLMNSNWVLAGLSAVVAGVSLFIDHMNSAAEAAERAQKRQAELDAQLAKSKEKIDMVTAPLESYKKALDGSNKSLEERNNLLKGLLKSEYQQYLDYLGIEIDGAYDLAKAYALVVKVLKQKKAYEEREQFRDEINSTNKYERMRAGMQFGQAAKAIGAENVDQEWLRRKLVVNQPIETIIQDVIKNAGGTSKTTDIGRGVQGISLYDKNGNLIDSKALDRLRKTIIDFNTSRVAENANDKLVDEQYKDLVGDFDNEKFQEEIIKAQLKRKGSLEKMKPDKEAEKAAKKAAQDRKKALKLEMDEAQKASTGIISKLEEYYRLQEAAINDARADGQLTENKAKEMVRALSILKNESLATARRAVTTGETKNWDELKTKVLPAVMSDTSEVSRNLLSTIQQVAVDKLHADLEKFNGSSNVLGLDSRAFFDQMNAKSAGNTREAARLKAKLFTQAETMVKQYRIFDQAVDKMRDDVEQMGFITETYEEFAERMQKGIMEKPDKVLPNGQTMNDKQIYSAMGFKFLGQGTIPYRINIENGDEALEWMRQFGTTASGELEVWAQAIPELEKWVTLLQRKAELQKDGKDLTADELAELQKAIPQIQALYYKMNEFSDKVPEAISKQVQQMTGRTPIGIVERQEQHTAQVDLTTQLYDNKINDARSSGNEDAALELEEQKKQALIDLEYKYQQELWQIREQMGVTIFDEYEHEVAMYKNMLDKKLISEEEFQKKRGELQMKLGLNVAQQYNGMMSNMVNALQEAEIASVEAKYDAEINAAKANGQDTAALEEQKEAEIMEIRKKYAGLQFAVKISEIIANTAVAIMMAYAQLGPIGGSIAAALLTTTGAAQLALAKAEYDKVMSMQAGGSKKSTSSAKAKPVSGMLTYDRGNVSSYAASLSQQKRPLLYDDGTTQVYGQKRRFIGQDGRVYTATEEPQPKDGLITHPIATTVQGQPALVAEKGPEIVIGRETTKAIMMNEPQLIKYLADYRKTGGFAGGWRPYDSGNVSEVSALSPQPSDINGMTAADARALIDAIGTFKQTVQQMQQKGIPCYINKYGRGGLIDEVQSGLKFENRYKR